MSLIKIKGITGISKKMMGNVRGGCSHTTAGGTTYECKTYHIVIKKAVTRDIGDSLTVNH